MEEARLIQFTAKMGSDKVKEVLLEEGQPEPSASLVEDFYFMSYVLIPGKVMVVARKTEGKEDACFSKDTQRFLSMFTLPPDTRMSRQLLETLKRVKEHFYIVSIEDATTEMQDNVQPT